MKLHELALSPAAAAAGTPSLGHLTFHLRLFCFHTSFLNLHLYPTTPNLLSHLHVIMGMPPRACHHVHVTMCMPPNAWHQVHAIMCMSPCACYHMSPCHAIMCMSSQRREARERATEGRRPDHTRGSTPVARVIHHTRDSPGDHCT